MNEVIKSKKKSAQTDWRVLVVDKLAMRMVSTCLKMHEISAEGITSKCSSTKIKSMLPSNWTLFFFINKYSSTS